MRTRTLSRQIAQLSEIAADLCELTQALVCHIAVLERAVAAENAETEPHAITPLRLINSSPRPE
jgi:hypothetical protein